MSVKHCNCATSYPNPQGYCERCGLYYGIRSFVPKKPNLESRLDKDHEHGLRLLAGRISFVQDGLEQLHEHIVVRISLDKLTEIHAGILAIADEIRAAKALSKEASK